MLQRTPSLLFLIFSLIYSFLTSVSATNSNIYVQCSQFDFNSLTPYESNVNSLFTSLVDSASVSNFNKFEISLPDYSQSDIVYGLFQCRGDVNSSNCKDCVANSISQLRTNCPRATGGAIQLEGCFVKYDNTSFFGVENEMEVLKKCGPSVGYDTKVLNRIDDALTYLIAGNGQYFHGGDFGSIQGVAQCIQDLSLTDCQNCLSEASGRLRSECETSSWGDMYLGKCYIRYADQGNDNKSSTNDDKHQGGGDIKTQVIGNIIAAVLSALVSTSVSYKITVHKINIHNYKVEQKVAGIRKDVDAVKSEAKKKQEKKDDKEKEEQLGLKPYCYPVPVPMPSPILVVTK